MNLGYVDFSKLDSCPMAYSGHEYIGTLENPYFGSGFEVAHLETLRLSVVSGLDEDLSGLDVTY